MPPDGKFVLAGYEVNLLPSTELSSRSTKNLNLPASIEVLTSLGTTGSEFEVRLFISSTFAGSLSSSSSATRRPGSAPRGSGRFAPFYGAGGDAKSPSLQDVVVTVPIPHEVHNIADLRASRGEAQFTPTESLIEWRIPTKDFAIAGNATLRCTLVGPLNEEDEEGTSNRFRFDTASEEYDEKEDAYQSSSLKPVKQIVSEEQQEQKDLRKVQQNAPFMPSSAAASFSVKGWWRAVSRSKR